MMRWYMKSLLFFQAVFNVEGHWEMVFRASTGVDKVIYNTWITKGGINEDNKTLQTTASHPAGVYRSSLLDSWQKEKMLQVKVAFYKNGIEVAQITFSARDSSYTNWFSQARVLSSSYGDIKTSPANVFSMKGERHDQVSRRFYANRNYGGCPLDKGWMMVVDSDMPTVLCASDGKADKPYFLYCPTTTSCLSDTQMVLADVFAVHIYRDTSGGRNGYFVKETTKNTSSDRRIVEGEVTRSLMECAGYCLSKINWCKAFYYSANTGFCQLVQIVNNSTTQMGTSSTGNYYYMF